MWHEQHLWELAEQELDGTLDPETKQSITEQTAQDPLFAAAHEERINILRSLRSQGRHIQFRQTLREIEHEARKPKTKVISLVGRHWKTAAIAACVALATSSITIFSLRSTTPKVTNRDLINLTAKVNHIDQQQDKVNEEILKIKKGQHPAPAPSDYSGTGFALTNDGYLVTNYHVTADADSIYIQTNDGNYYKTEVIAYEPGTDVAVLKVTDKKFRFGKTDVPYTLATGRTPLGSPIYTLGYPQDEVVYNEGYISSRHGYEGDTTQYRLEVPANPGQSGSPVLDSRGNVVAIVSSKEGQSEATTFAVTSRTLLRLLHHLSKTTNINLNRTNRLSNLSREQQVEQLQNYTCMVRVYKK